MQVRYTSYIPTNQWHCGARVVFSDCCAGCWRLRICRWIAPWSMYPHPRCITCPVGNNLWSGFSAQVFQHRVDNRPNPRDLYKGEPFCRCFPVQAKHVQWSRGKPAGTQTKTPRIAARHLERKIRRGLFPIRSSVSG